MVVDYFIIAIVLFELMTPWRAPALKTVLANRQWIRQSFNKRFFFLLWMFEKKNEIRFCWVDYRVNTCVDISCCLDICFLQVFAFAGGVGQFLAFSRLPINYLPLENCHLWFKQNLLNLNLLEKIYLFLFQQRKPEDTIKYCEGN